MATKPIQPADIIFVVDYQTEEIYEMRAGEFAVTYCDILCDVRYNYDAMGFYVHTVDLQTGAADNSTIYSNRLDALQDKDRKSTRLNSSHLKLSRMPSSA